MADTAPRRSTLTVRVAAYNVLAQCLAKSSYFTFASKSVLKWANRSKALASLVPGLGDIICLSEVDYVPHWRETLEPEFVLLHQLRGTKQYGNAIAFRRTGFRLVDAAACNFDDVAEVAGASTELFKRSCVAVFAALQPLPLYDADDPLPPLLIVVSTHLFWDPSLPAVRAAQAGMLQLCLADFTSRARVLPGCGGMGPLIVAGDLNSLPGSVAHRMLTQLPIITPVAKNAWSSGWDLLGMGGDGASGFSVRPPAPDRAPCSSARAAWLSEVAVRLPMWLKHAADEASVPPSPTTTAKDPPEGVFLRSAFAWHKSHGIPPESYAAECAAEPSLTTATDTFRGTLDYVLVSRPACAWGAASDTSSGGSPPTASVFANEAARDGAGSGAGLSVVGETATRTSSWYISAVGPLPGSEAPPMPNSECPSDHFPVTADVSMEF